MIIGNLENVFENEQTINEAIQNNFSRIDVKKPSKWSKLLFSLSHYGMNYHDDIYKNMVAIPADNNLIPKQNQLLMNSMIGFSGIGSPNPWRVKGEEEKPFNEKNLGQRRDVLRKMAQNTELEDILDVMSNECIVYDDDFAYIGQPFLDTALIQDLNEESAKEIKKAMDTSFYKIYTLLQWKTEAWDNFKRWLIDGVVSYEIVYDNLENPKTILNVVPLDPATLTKTIIDGVVYWIQFKDVIGRERKLLDAQVIYIKYEDSGVTARQSYLERLIRPFNLYRIVEQAQVIWTVTQSSFKTLFTIPVSGMSKAKGAQTLAQAMNRYKEDISFDQETGSLQVNGKMNLPFNKEYWLPENEAGRPEIETLVDNGPQLNDSDQIRYFLANLYKLSKIPANRFDKEAQSTWFGTDPTAALRDEIDFARFVTRLRNTFIQILLKPLKIQIALMLPDIKNDKRILDSVSFRFNSYNLFEEMMNIEVLTKRIEFIGTMKDSLTVTDSEGNEVPFFSMKFLLEKYLKLSDADMELNAKYKLEESLSSKGEDEEGEGGDEEESKDSNESDEMLGGGGSEDESESDENEDIDDEMLGDVQNESPETAQA